MGRYGDDRDRIYGLVQDLVQSGSFGTFNPEEFWMFVPYYEEGKGFYWKSRGAGHDQSEAAKYYQVHFSFLPHYRNFGDSVLDPYEGATCPHDVRMFFIMTKCETTWNPNRHDPPLCHPSELFQDSKISLEDIGETQSGIINDAIYHQIYCVPSTERATKIERIECTGCN